MGLYVVGVTGGFTRDGLVGERSVENIVGMGMVGSGLTLIVASACPNRVIAWLRRP